MVAPAFGWSTGDLLQAIKTIYEISKGFRDVGGAESHFQLSAAWLESFGRDLDQVRRFMETNPDATCSSALQEKLLLIRSSYNDFKEYLDKYDAFLPSTVSAHRSRLKSGMRSARKASQTVRWSWKELNHRVDDLRRSVTLPLAEMNLVLLLHVEENLRKLSHHYENLPQSSDLLEIKDVVAEHASQLAHIAATGDEILNALRKNKSLALLDEQSSLADEMIYCTALERLGRLIGHFGLEPITADDGCPLFVKVSQLRGTAEARIVEFQERLSSITGASDEATERIFAHLDKSKSNILELMKQADEVMELEKQVNQMTQELFDVRRSVEETRNQVHGFNTQAALHTGVSVAAATTSVVCLLKTFLDDRSQEQKTSPGLTTDKKVFHGSDVLGGIHGSRDMTAPHRKNRTASTDLASFEAKWAVLARKCSGRTSLLQDSSPGHRSALTSIPSDSKLVKHLESTWRQKVDPVKPPSMPRDLAAQMNQVSEHASQAQEQIMSQEMSQNTDTATNSIEDGSSRSSIPSKLVSSYRTVTRNAAKDDPHAEESEVDRHETTP